MNISKDIVISKKTLTLEAKEHRTINQPGRFFLLISNSLGTDLQVAIGNDSYQSWPVLFSARVEKPGDYFEKVKFYNDASAAMTVEYVISNIIVESTQFDVLNQLQGDTQPKSWGLRIVTAAPGATQLFYEKIDRKGCIIQALFSNTDNVWLGFSDSVVVNTAAFAVLQPGMSFSIDAYRGAIWAIATTAQKVSIGEW